MTLEGNLGFDIGGIGALSIKVGSKISEKGIEFSGEVPSVFQYRGFVLNSARAVFNTKEKSAELLGDVMIESLACKAHFILQRDPKEPADSRSGRLFLPRRPRWEVLNHLLDQVFRCSIRFLLKISKQG